MRKQKIKSTLPPDAISDINSLSLALLIPKEQVEEIITTFYYVQEQVIKRGMNMELGGIRFKNARSILSKQRIGDQKAVIESVRFSKPIHLQRHQTYLKHNKTKTNE